MSLRIAGIDQSITSTGFVLMEVAEKGPFQVIDAARFGNKNTNDPLPLRIQEVAATFFQKVMKGVPPDLVVFEYPLVSGRHAPMLYALYATMWNMVHHSGVDRISILPLHREWFLTGKMRNKKSAIVEAVLKDYQWNKEDFGRLSSDLADAYVLARLGRSFLNLFYGWYGKTDREQTIFLKDGTGLLNRGKEFVMVEHSYNNRRLDVAPESFSFIKEKP